METKIRLGMLQSHLLVYNCCPNIPVIREVFYFLVKKMDLLLKIRSRAVMGDMCKIDWNRIQHAILR